MVVRAKGKRKPWSYIDLFASLNYNPLTGVWTRLIRSGPRGAAGSRADYKHARDKYRSVSFCNYPYSSHRLAWKYMTGAWPTKGIDHVDTDASNNAWHNLREATPSQNAANARLSKANTSGHRGVYYYQDEKKWIAKIGLGGKDCHLGRFATFEEAVAARLEAATKAFGEFARHA